MREWVSERAVFAFQTALIREKEHNRALALNAVTAIPRLN